VKSGHCFEDLESIPYGDEANMDSRDTTDLVTELNKTLTDLFDSFRKTANEKISQTFDRFTKRLDKTESDLTKLQAENSTLKTELGRLDGKVRRLEEDLDVKTDEQEQYGRRNALRFKGVPVNDIPQLPISTGSNKMIMDTDTFIRNFCQEMLGICVKPDQISRSHVVGMVRDGKCTILIKFISYNVRNLIYRKRAVLKDKAPGIYINEDLTKTRSKCLSVLLFLRKKEVIHSAWSFDGRILYRQSEGDNVTQVSSVQGILSKFPGSKLPTWV
jgi:hypothetical protein